MNKSVLLVIFGLFSASPLTANAQTSAQQTPLLSPPATANVYYVDDSEVPKDVTDPNKLSPSTQLFCSNHILDTVNKIFGSSFNEEDVQELVLRESKREFLGFVRGGGYNIHIISAAVPSDVAEKIHAGRYANRSTWLRFGIAPSLHVEDGFDGQRTFMKKKNENGTYSVEFFAHIDSAYALAVPVGTMTHYFRDVRGWRTRNPCPGADPEADRAADAQAAQDASEIQNP